MQLSPRRRHQKSCPHAAKGWNFTLCNCPIWAYGTLKGAPFRRSLDTTSWDRAMLRIGRLERGEDVGFLPPAGRSVQEAIETYLEDAAARNLKAASLESYTRTLRQFSDFVGHLSVSSLTVDHFAGFRARRIAKPGVDEPASMAPRTQRKEIEYLRAFSAFCVVRGWLDKNLAKRVKPPKIEEVATLPYTRKEVDDLLLACDRMRGMWKSDTPFVRQHARALVLTLLYSGLRASDIAQLRRAALEPTGHLVLRITKTGVPLKVLLHPDAAAALRGLPANGADPTYFFWSGRGRLKDCAKSLWRTVSRVGRVAKVHAYPHRFRDTFAVELLTNGADIRTVQQLLGHDSVKTTEKHYAHFVAAHQRILDSAAASLDFRPRPAGPLLVRSLQN